MFYLIGSMASAFSGILAWGFSQMNGLGNIGKYGGLKYGPLYYGPTKISGVSGPSGIESGMAGWYVSDISPPPANRADISTGGGFSSCRAC